MKEELLKALNAIENWLVNFGWNFLRGLSIIILGFIVLKIVIKIIKRFIYRSPLDNTVCTFIFSIVKFLLYVVYMFLIADVIGIPMASFVTILATGGLAIGLAVQGSLSNLANGIVLIFTKPFKEGDFVEINDISGTVSAINMLSTELTTPDNKKIIVPNSNITSENIINYNGRTTRRVDFSFDVAYGSDIELVKKTVLNVINNHPRVLKNQDAMCRLKFHAASSLTFIARCYVNRADYWDVYYDIMEGVLAEFDKALISIPYQTIDINVKKEQ